MAGASKNGRILEMAFGLLAMAALAAILPAAEPPAPHPSLQGTWTLNEDLTARMRETDQQHGTKRGSGGGGFGRRGGGGGGRRGGGPSGDPTGDPTGGPDVMEMDPKLPDNPHPSLAPATELTITQQGKDVTITDKEGHSRLLHTDGTKVKDAKGPGGPVEIQASWDKEGSLVVTTRPDRGPKRTESYIVSDDGKHLYIVLSVDGDGSRPEIKIRRAYDPATPPEKPAAPESSDEGETELA